MPVVFRETCKHRVVVREKTRLGRRQLVVNSGEKTSFIEILCYFNIQLKTQWLELGRFIDDRKIFV